MAASRKPEYQEIGSGFSVDEKDRQLPGYARDVKDIETCMKVCTQDVACVGISFGVSARSCLCLTPARTQVPNKVPGGRTGDVWAWVWGDGSELVGVREKQERHPVYVVYAKVAKGIDHHLATTIDWIDIFIGPIGIILTILIVFCAQALIHPREFFAFFGKVWRARLDHVEEEKDSDVESDDESQVGAIEDEDGGVGSSPKSCRQRCCRRRRLRCCKMRLPRPRLPSRKRAAAPTDGGDEVDGDDEGGSEPNDDEDGAELPAEEQAGDS